MTKGSRIRIIGVTGAFLAAGAVSGCAYGPELAVPVTHVPNEKLTIYGIRAHSAERGILVSGSVPRPGLSLGPLWGHLHIVASVQDGPPIAVDTRWSGNLSGRGYRSASFSTLIRTSMPDRVEAISVSYRAGSDQSKRKPRRLPAPPTETTDTSQ
jgi:hypothetical protein